MSTGSQSAPAVHVKNKAGLAAVRRAVEEWIALDPEEVKRWRLYQDGIRQAHEWTGGWSPSRELLALGHAPSYVIFRTAQLLRSAGWEIDAARTWDVEFSCGKAVPSSLWKQAVRDLLPEMQTARKERIQRFHTGVSL